jgi:hypothetical protein
MNDLVGQLKAVEAPAVLGKLLFLASLKLIHSFLVSSPTRITLCEQRAD